MVNTASITGTKVIGSTSSMSIMMGEASMGATRKTTMAPDTTASTMAPHGRHLTQITRRQCHPLSNSDVLVGVRLAQIDRSDVSNRSERLFERAGGLRNSELPGLNAMHAHAAINRFVLVAGTLLFLVLVAPVRSAYAAPDAITPVEDFSRELDKLKKSFGDLGKKIDGSAKMIDGLSVEGLSDVDKAKKEIEDLRAGVSSLLAVVADNGTLDKLGDKALSRARDKLKELEQDSRFKQEEKNFLIEQWRRLRDDTERATQELGSARSRFAELLRTLQANEDFIDELMQIRQAQKVIDVIRQLTREIRGTSDQLQRLISGIKPPGA
jgi:methyl-accepting chemotaxis protein